MRKSKKNKQQEIDINQAEKYSDLGTPEAQRRGVTITYNPQTGYRTARVKYQQPIDHYRDRYLDEYQYEAATKMQEDHKMGCMACYVNSSANYDFSGRSDAFVSEAAIEARARISIIRSRLSAEEWLVVSKIVLDDGYLNEYRNQVIEFSEDQVAAAARALIASTLIDALDKVSKFYGIK